VISVSRIPKPFLIEFITRSRAFKGTLKLLPVAKIIGEEEGPPRTIVSLKCPLHLCWILPTHSAAPKRELRRNESALWQPPGDSTHYGLAFPSGMSVGTASLDTSRVASPTASS
jgi:hypothetical protein